MYLFVCLVSEEEKESVIKVLQEIDGDIKFYSGPFNEARSELLNSTNHAKINIITSSVLKSQRYEVFCIAKRFRLTYGVIYDKKLNLLESPQKNTKHDNPLAIYDPKDPKEAILPLFGFKALKKSFANKKKVTPDENYLLAFKRMMERINDKWGVDQGGIISLESENRFLKVINLHPVGMSEGEECYEKIVVENMKIFKML